VNNIHKQWEGRRRGRFIAREWKEKRGGNTQSPGTSKTRQREEEEEKRI
jgi:hypothetical protein